MKSKLPSRLAAFSCFLLSAFCFSANAQPAPHVGYVYPAGGRQGTTFQIVVAGQFLDGVTDAHVSGSGVKAAVVDFNKPMPQGEFNRLRDKMRELQEKRQAAFKNNRKSDRVGTNASTNTWTAADEKQIEEIRTKILKNPPNRNASPAIAETVTIKVTLGADAEPGEREIRLATPNGLSNPLVFRVGSTPEFSAPGAKAPNPDADRFKDRFDRQVNATPTNTDLRITLPATVNGQIMPGEVDRLRFSARKGRQLVVAASARELIPYLADAVPGWFQAALTVYDAKGKELAYNDDFRFHPDPVLHFEIPRDGDYVIEIKDAIYRGREDFVYRITAGELPFVTSIFPLGGPVGAETKVEVKGWNLEGSSLLNSAGPNGTAAAQGDSLSPSEGERVRVRGGLRDDSVSTGSGEAGVPLTPALSPVGGGEGEISPAQVVKFASPGVYPISVRKGDWISNHAPFAVDTLPECREAEPNNDAKSAQRLTLPVIVNGRIDRSGDWDVFSFAGRAGEEIVAEVHARRLDSPLDSVLKLTDATGKQIAFNDDYEDKASGLNTHHADSYLRATLPARGTYFLHLGDTQRQGGGEFAYRLRVSAPQPDFALRVVPSSISVRGGASVPLTVYALRQDGCTNEITLVLKDAPAGFTLDGGRVPANADQVRVTLTAPPTATDEPVSVKLQGRAVIQGDAVIHPVVPADDMMQAFAYRHLVPARELDVAVSGRFMSRMAVKILGDSPVKIPAGGTVRVRVAGPPGAFTDRLQLELSEPPEGITIKNVSPNRDGAEIVLLSDAAKTKPGLKGNLVVTAYATGNAAPPGKAKKQANNRRAAWGTLPAIPFEVVAE